jgi:hypothetical protein
MVVLPHAWWLPGSGSLRPWDIAVHGEEEKVVQLLKRVTMPPSKAAPVIDSGARRYRIPR